MTTITLITAFLIIIICSYKKRLSPTVGATILIIITLFIGMHIGIIISNYAYIHELSKYLN